MDPCSFFFLLALFLMEELNSISLNHVHMRQLGHPLDLQAGRCGTEIIKGKSKSQMIKPMMLAVPSLYNS